MYGYPDKIRYFLLGSIFILISIVTSAETANAEPVLIKGIEGECTVNKQNNSATLQANSENTILSSKTEDGGSPETVTILCTSPTQITISAPLQTTGATDFLASALSATATSPELNLDIQSNGTKTQKLPGEPEGAIIVNMKADNDGQPISPGEYKFTVTLTIAPD
jgi:type VI protein secretion system component Hcp